MKAVYFVDGEGDVEANIAFLTEKIHEAPIDVGIIGIGENGHIAFNDPPADFETEAAYHVVNLDERCRRQQLGEGWFENLDAVPKQAISMTVKEILRAKCIVSVVPHAVKAEAIFNTCDTFTVRPEGEIVIRPRQSGDEIRLPGGTKTLKKLLTSSNKNTL